MRNTCSFEYDPNKTLVCGTCRKRKYMSEFIRTTLFQYDVQHGVGLPTCEECKEQGL